MSTQKKMMTPEIQDRIKHLTRELAAALWETKQVEDASTLEEIEVHVRDQILEFVAPEIGVFLLKRQPIQQQEEQEPSIVRLGS